MTERVLVLRPVPQDLVQAPYLDQPETLQSMGQAWVLHTRDSLVGHSSPPCLAAMSTAYVRDWTPVPQDLEQAVQAFQECSQSMGQGWVLQFCSAVETPQAAPPWAAVLTTDLERVWTPPPHTSEQPPKADQPESLQSMGQAKALQVAKWE